MCPQAGQPGGVGLAKMAGRKNRPGSDSGSYLYPCVWRITGVTALIRRMTLADIPAVHEIDVLSFSLPWPERSFRFELTENQVSRGWVAEVDGKIAAMLMIWFIVDEAHIATIAVHPDFRRQGIGEQILLHALRAAHNEGAQRAFLEVRAGNAAAQAMYKKYGFEMVGVRPGYYKDNNEDALLMNLEKFDCLEAV
jgi:ribosomal-protein-alanine N-acetyltransferase